MGHDPQHLSSMSVFQLFPKTFLGTLFFTCVAPILARYLGIWRPNVVPQGGVEPPTCGFSDHRSYRTELPRHKINPAITGRPVVDTLDFHKEKKNLMNVNGASNGIRTRAVCMASRNTTTILYLHKNGFNADLVN